MSKNPSVSVIIPTHNRASFLTRAVDSVLAQTYLDFELIVVDDASTDRTQHVIAGFDDPRLRSFRHQQNRGASAARNTGMASMRGNYVSFLDDDDEWVPTKLADQVDQLDAAPREVGMVYGWMDYFDPEGRRVGEVHPTLKGHVFDDVLVKQAIGGCPTLLVRSTVVQEVGGFDERLHRGNDGDFIRRVCQRYEVDVLPKVLAKIHVGHDRISNTTQEGLSAHLTSLKIRLQKFECQFVERPKARGAIFRELAITEMKLGNRVTAVATFFSGAKLDFASHDTVFDTLRLLKAFVA